MSLRIKDLLNRMSSKRIANTQSPNHFKRVSRIPLLHRVTLKLLSSTEKSEIDLMLLISCKDLMAKLSMADDFSNTSLQESEQVLVILSLERLLEHLEGMSSVI